MGWLVETPRFPTALVDFRVAAIILQILPRQGARGNRAGRTAPRPEHTSDY
jgi:hypothetical protein